MAQPGGMVRVRKGKHGNPNPGRRAPCPPYNKLVLREQLESYVQIHGVKQAFQLGVYTNLPQSHAVRGHGLVALKGLIMAVLEAVPNGFLLFSAWGLKLHRRGGPQL